MLEAMLERAGTRISVPDNGSLRADLLQFADTAAANAASPEVSAMARAVVAGAPHDSTLADAARDFWAAAPRARRRHRRAGDRTARGRRRHRSAAGHRIGDRPDPSAAAADRRTSRSRLPRRVAQPRWTASHNVRPTGLIGEIPLSSAAEPVEAPERIVDSAAPGHPPKPGGSGASRPGPAPAGPSRSPRPGPRPAWPGGSAGCSSRTIRRSVRSPGAMLRVPVRPARLLRQHSRRRRPPAAARPATLTAGISHDRAGLRTP